MDAAVGVEVRPTSGNGWWKRPTPSDKTGEVQDTLPASSCSILIENTTSPVRSPVWGKQDIDSDFK